MLEKYTTNKNMSGNLIILKILSLKAISVRSLRTVFSQFWKCFVTFERTRIKENPNTFFKLLGSWSGEKKKKTNFQNLKIALSWKSWTMTWTFKFRLYGKPGNLFSWKSNEIFEYPVLFLVFTWRHKKLKFIIKHDFGFLSSSHIRKSKFPSAW